MKLWDKCFLAKRKPRKKVRSNGSPLGADSRVYRLLADNTTLNITPTTSRNNYTFDFGFTKHIPTVYANGNALDDNQPNVEFCVGQGINLLASLVPDVPGATTTYEWLLPGEFVNASQQVASDHSVNYYIEWPLLWAQNTYAWWVSGGLKPLVCKLMVTVPGGQTFSIDAVGKMDMYRPTVTIVQTYPNGFMIHDMGILTTWHTLKLGQLDHISDFHHKKYEAQIPTRHWGHAGITQITSLIAAAFGYQCSGLDAREWYWPQTPIPANQSPGPTDNLVSLDDGPESHWWQPNYLTGDFVDYVRFQPNGNQSIPVTLGRIFWSCAGYSLVYPDITLSSSVSGPSGPDNSTEFPEWTTICLPNP